MRLLTPFVLLTSFACTAQPVLQYANVSLIGKTFPLNIVSDPGTSDPSPDGANVTWDFSSATVVMDAAFCSFVDPATTPYAASYPIANLAQVVDVSGTPWYNYFILSATELSMLAEEVGSGSEIIYTDPKTPLVFPYAYTDNYVDEYTYDATDYTLTRAYTGYGTAILPTGTYTNVVKMTTSDGSFDFFRSNPVEPLITITEDGTVLVWGDAISGVNEATGAPALSAQPNPTGDLVNVRGLTSAGTWQLLDAQGRLQRSGAHLPGTLSVDLTELAPSPYSLVVFDALGTRTVRIVKR